MEGPDFDRDEAPPSSQTPVVFETGLAPLPTPASGAPPPSAPTKRAVARKLAPLALLPLLVAAALPLAGSAPAARVAVVGTDLAAPPPADDDLLEVVTTCPENMSFVARDKVRVCIDRWEASLVEVLPNGVEQPHSPYVTPSTWAGMKVKAVSLPGVVPQAYVTRYQADLACKNAGKRLCRPEEWQTACEGPTKQTYPYGNAEDRKACNTHGKNPLSILYGGLSKVHYGKAMQHPALNTYEGTLAKTGEFDRCTNGFGVYDMVGNLHEWVAGAPAAFRGGYYQDDKTNAPGCRYKTTAHGPTYGDYSTGFRCCADPK